MFGQAPDAVGTRARTAVGLAALYDFNKTWHLIGSVNTGIVKGPQVTEILSVDSSTAQQEMPRRGRPERPIYPPANQAVVDEIGTIKWYNAKGFGFIGSDRGGRDIFVHTTVLNRAGITDLAEGQRVAVDVVDGRKGPEAASLRLI